METLISSHHYVWALKTVSISSNFSTFSKSDLFKVWERYDLIMAFYANSIYGQRMESTWVARGLPGGLALSVCKARSTLLATPVVSLHLSQLPFPLIQDLLKGHSLRQAFPCLSSHSHLESISLQQGFLSASNTFPSLSFYWSYLGLRYRHKWQRR